MSTAPQQPVPTSGLTGSLHYGGSINRKTRTLGSKPHQGRQFKAHKRLETIVRLENAGFTESATAAMLVISVPRLRTIKKSPGYIAARAAITHGIIIDWDSKLAAIKEHRKEVLTQMLPQALQIVANEMMRPALTLAERKHQTELARDWMDREGTFAKISRAEIKPVDNFDFEQVDKISDSMINTIKGVAAPPRHVGEGSTTAAINAFAVSAGVGAHTLEAIEANVAFSNSHTLSQTDQEKALARLEEEAAAKGIVLAQSNGEGE